ncbi:MAG: SCO family protein [bacterium]
MKAINNFIKWLFWFILGMIILSTAAFYLYNSQQKIAADIPVYNQLPTFSFTSHTGDAFGLDQIQGKINVVDFIFTNCGAACPIMTTEMSELYNNFAQMPQVQFISISVDPENDTIERLNEFAQGYGVTDHRWQFLRGPIAEVSDLAEKGFLVSDDFPGNHSTKFILVDRQAKVRGYFDSYDRESLDSLKTTIQQLAKK